MSVEHLSAEDATVWCAQAPEVPLQLGGVVVCEGSTLRDERGAVPIERIRRHVQTRLISMPRFRKVLREVPLGQGLVWVDDRHFDITRHLRVAALPRPGCDEQLRDFVARLLETPFPPDRPPWELWVIEGLAGDRVALVPKVSHILGDGMAILALVLSLFDFEPRTGEDPAQPWEHTPPPRPASLLAGAFYRRRRHQAAVLGDVVRMLVRPRQLPGRTTALAKAGQDLLTFASPLPIARPVGPRRDFAWVQLSLTDLERVKRFRNVKLNDVVLAIATAGLSSYLEREGTRVPRLRVVVPVSVHGVNPVGEIENRFSMMFVGVENIADPLEHLRAVHAATTRGKASLQTGLGMTVLTLGGLLPQRVLRTLAPRLLRHQRFVNVVVTNLSGSRQPMYLFGSRVLAMYPFVTVTANLTVMIGVVSYADTLGVGITVDADACPDATVLALAIREAAQELVAAATEAAIP